MADITLKITASGAESIVDDIKREFPMTAMKRVAGSIYQYMTEKLAEHINTDVYGASHPKVYPRRSEHPGYGPPLSDMEANADPFGYAPTSGQIMNGDYSFSVGLSYHPSGEHTGRFGDFYSQYEMDAWDYPKDEDDPIKPKPVHGDDLIRRIETGRGYDWHYNQARPFWGNFVDELVSHGFSEALNNALVMEGFTTLPDPGDLQREPQDGNY